MKGTETKYLKWYQKVAYGAGDLASNTRACLKIAAN